jgi:ABC-2 type transport system ATP-binding protein
VLERLGRLEGVSGVTRRSAAGGRVAVTLSADTEEDLRPKIFQLAKECGWTLYELHQERGNLEALFRQLTAEEAGEQG